MENLHIILSILFLIALVFILVELLKSLFELNNRKFTIDLLGGILILLGIVVSIPMMIWKLFMLGEL